MYTTLTYLIIAQNVISVQAGKFPGINKRAGCNKAVQVGIFQESTVKKLCRLEKLLKLINVQVGFFQKNNKCAGYNKAVQVGIFQESIVKKTCRLEKFQKLINVQDVIRLCRLDFFKKIIKRAACLLDRLE